MSHSSKQKLFVKELRRYLPDSFNLWIDEKEILIGKPIENTLKNAIENDCDFLILILDSYSVKSDWVKKEIDWALEKERKIKRTFLLTIVTEEEAIPLVQNKDVLSKKFLKCSGQEDIQIEALAKSLTSELLGLLCEIIDNRNNIGKDVKDVIGHARELSTTIENSIKKVLIPYRARNPLSLEKFSSELIDCFQDNEIEINDTYTFLLNLKNTGYLKGIYFDDEIIYLNRESYNFKSEIHKAIKKRIAREGFNHINDGMTIGIDGGSSTLEVAKLLSNALLQNSLSNITVISNSITIVNLLTETLSKLNLNEDNSRCNVYLVGGKARPTSLTTISFNPNEIDNYSDWEKIISQTGKIDICFLGTNGVKDSIGFSNKHKFELTAKKALFNNSNERIILTDPSKFLVEQEEVFAPFNESMIVITSGEDEYPEAINKFQKVIEDKESNVKLIIV